MRRRGSGHRRRISEARASRTSSIYETIDEAPESLDGLSKQSVEPIMTHDLSVADINAVRWASDDVGPALGVIHALQNEVRLAVDASRQQWADTAYSIDVLQSMLHFFLVFSNILMFGQRSNLLQTRPVGRPC